MKRNPAFRRPPILDRETLLLARWLTGDTIPLDTPAGLEAVDTGTMLLSLPGSPPLPWTAQRTANLLANGDVERLQKALASR